MKRLLLAILLLGTGISAYAQGFTFGPKVGINHTKLVSPKNFVHGEFITGYQLGVFARIGAGRLYIQPEAYYTTKSSRLRIDHDADQSGGTSIRGRVEFRNVDIPLLLGYKLIDLKLANVRLLAGPVLSYTLGEKTKGLSALDPSAYNYSRNSWGLQAGLGVDIGMLSLDARYEYGLTEVNRFFDQKPNLFMLSLGFKFL